MSDDDLREPLVILERHDASGRSPGGAFPDGPRPEILLVHEEEGPGGALGHLLFDAGFDVVRTSGTSSARDLVRSRPSLRMALIRLDRPALEPVSLIRDLALLCPGLWIGMHGGAGDRSTAREGYQVGADDLLPLEASAETTAQRLARSVTWARNKHARAARRRSPRVRTLVATRMASVIALGIGLGIVMGAALRAGQDVLSLEDARLLRLEKAWTEGLQMSVGPLQAARRLEGDRLEMERRRLAEELYFHREQLSEGHLDQLFQKIVPHYPTP